MNKIYYVGYYFNHEFNEDNRVGSLAANGLMDYISKVLSKNNTIDILSPSWTKNKNGYYSGGKYQINENIYLNKTPTISQKNIFVKLLSIIISQVWLFLYLIINANKLTIVIVYHSPTLFLPVYLSKLFKRYKLILQVCEIYKDAGSAKFPLDIFEEKLIFCADSYILSTKLLLSRYGISKKNYVVCSGIYQYEFRVVSTSPNEKIRIVYAGIIDTIKLGAFHAIESALFLNDNYEIFIVGFGIENEIEKLKNRILEINLLSKAKVYYLGSKNGDDFINFLQSCHIGLSTQAKDSDFSQSSFPAKIFSYLSNHLDVVSIEAPSIVQSDIAKNIFFYENNNPKEIANTINSAMISKNKSISNNKVLNSLNNAFIININKLINMDYND